MKLTTEEIQVLLEWLQSIEDDAVAQGGAVTIPDETDLAAALQTLSDPEVRAGIDDPPAQRGE